MQFDIIKTEGKTTATTNDITYEYSMSPSFSIGFGPFASAGFNLNLGRIDSNSVTDSLESSVTKQYSYPLSVPPHQTLMAEAVVQEGEMTIPYDLVVSIGGSTVKKPGMWQGIPSSVIRYKIGLAEN